MTEQDQTVIIEEAVAPARFAKFKEALTKVEPVYVVAALTTVAAVVGITLVGRAEKKASKLGDEFVVIDVEPEPEN